MFQKNRLSIFKAGIFHISNAPRPVFLLKGSTLNREKGRTFVLVGAEKKKPRANAEQ